MLSCAYDKTEKGREEIATRKYQLANRLRTLLVMVDGKKSAAELLKNLTAIGLDENSIQELIELEMIAPSVAIADAPESTESHAPLEAESETAPIEENKINPVQSSTDSGDQSEAEQFQAIYNFLMKPSRAP